MRYALRALARSPGFAIAVIVTLALGIGANTAVFSVLRGVLLRPLPHRGGDRIVYLRQSAARAGQENVLFSVPEIIDYRTQSKRLTGFGEISQMTFTMLGSREPMLVRAGIVSGNYFEVMGLDPILGRLLDARDDGPAAAPAMVLTHAFWRRHFGGDPDVIGRTLRVNGRTLTILGVVEPAPTFHPAYSVETDVFVNVVTSPHHLDATMVHGRSHRMTEVFARLEPGVTVEQAQVELDEIAARVHRDHPQDYEAAAGYKLAVIPLRDALTSRAKQTLYLLMATAALVLLTACANTANLVLTRSVRRERELTVRWALGADRGRLRRLLLTETGILAAAGAVAGLVLAYLMLDLLVGFAGRFTPRAAEIHLDPLVLTFAAVVATGAALIFAFVPSLRAQEEAGAALSRTGTRATGGGQRLQRGLIVAQVAATVTALTVAGLLGKTLLRLYAVDTGVRLENTLSLEAPIDFDGRPPEQQLAVQEEALRRLAQIPGVSVAGVGWNVPLRSSQVQLEIKAEGRPEVPGVPTPRAEYRTATPGYFDAAGIRLLSGRQFTATDRAGAGRVAIINQSLARRLFGDQNPLGRRVAWTGDVLRFIGMAGDWRTVVGVIADTKDAGPDAPAPMALYEPLAQVDLKFYAGAFVIHGPGAPHLGIEVTKAIRDVAPEQPIEHLATLEEVREANLAPQRLNAALIGALGILALVIAAVGIGGVLAFFVSQRTTEIGIRMSLGAAPSGVMRMVLADGGVLLGIGIALGLLGSVVSARLLQGLLFGVAPRDPLTLLLVALVTGVVGISACALPALRAARVDPMVAIRAE
jgi:predicted permease